jgi:hypothetical protein
MTTWCTYCDAEATHAVQEILEPLCTTCAAVFKAGQASPDASVVPMPEFEVVEEADERRELTYRVRAVSAERARRMVEEGLVGPIENKSIAQMDGFRNIEFKSVKPL